MKLAPEGKVKFRMMSLEESENTDAVGLKKALDNSFHKLKLELEISNAMVGMCTDGPLATKMLLQRNVMSSLM